MLVTPILIYLEYLLYKVCVFLHRNAGKEVLCVAVLLGAAYDKTGILFDFMYHVFSCFLLLLVLFL